MDRLLVGRDHLAGDYSYADIAFFMAQFFAARMAVPLNSASWPHLAAWRLRIAQRQAVRRVVDAMSGFLLRANRPVPTYV